MFIRLISLCFFTYVLSIQASSLNVNVDDPIGRFNLAVQAKDIGAINNLLDKHLEELVQNGVSVLPELMLGNEFAKEIAVRIIRSRIGLDASNSRETPLLVAISAGFDNGYLIKLLLKNGAHLNVPSRFGTTPDSVDIPIRYGITPLGSVIETQNVNAAQLILREFRNQITPQEIGKLLEFSRDVGYIRLSADWLNLAAKEVLNPTFNPFKSPDQIIIQKLWDSLRDKERLLLGDLVIDPRTPICIAAGSNNTFMLDLFHGYMANLYYSDVGSKANYRRLLREIRSRCTIRSLLANTAKSTTKTNFLTFLQEYSLGAL